MPKREHKPVGLKAFREELIASILDEKRQFNMARYKSGTTPEAATCKTACCMIGHIQAIRQRRANQLLKAGFSTEIVAEMIWEEETGAECRLDFYATKYNGKNPEIWNGYGQSRKEAVAHIRGRSKIWPLLAKAPISRGD